MRAKAKEVPGWIDEMSDMNQGARGDRKKMSGVVEDIETGGEALIDVG